MDTRLCVAVWLSLCMTSVTSSDVFFTAKPSTLRPLLTDDLTMRCSLKDSASSVVVGKRQLLSDVTRGASPGDVSFVQSIVLTKSGVDVATVAVQLGVKVFDNSTDIEVSGQVSGAGDEMGYLQVKWKYPGPSQTGTFQYMITGTEPNGHVKTFTQTLDVFEGEASLNDIVAYVKQVKLTNDKQAATIASLNSTNFRLNSTVTVLNSTVANLNVLVNDLKTSNADMMAKINQNTASNTELKTKQDTHVIFSAFLDNELTVQKGDVVVFEKLHNSIGGGFDLTTGVFTAPVAGWYMFVVHVVGQLGKNAGVCIVQDGVGCFERAFADDQLGYQSGSGSVIIPLKRGDTVKVVSSDRTSYFYGSGETSFSGHLIALT